MFRPLQKSCSAKNGSNLSGRHGKGAAKTAQDRFGAIYGQADGLQGRSYALPTVDAAIRNRLPIPAIAAHVQAFLAFAQGHPELIFLVTEVGCGLAGWRVQDIAGLFKDALGRPNVVLPARFHEVIDPTYHPMLPDAEVKAEIGGIQVIDDGGSCILHWPDRSRPDFPVSIAEPSGKRFVETLLVRDLCALGVGDTVAAEIAKVCW
jgi:hypothetical protein